MGHDRFQADLRPLLSDILKDRSLQPGLCCHPYDLCTELIAREAGVLITDQAGLRLNPPLDLKPDVSWAGYANGHIRSQIEPLLQQALKARGLAPAR
jgi:hypothetical protein